MTDAIFAWSTLLKIGNGADTEVFTTIAEVTNIGGPSLALEAVDVTSHSSANGWREFIGALLDAGEVTLTINFIPTNATHSQSTGLVADMVARTLRNFQLVFSDSGSTTWSFAALVTGFESSEPVDAELSADVTLKLSGQPTLVG